MEWPRCGSEYRIISQYCSLSWKVSSESHGFGAYMHMKKLYKISAGLYRSDPSHPHVSAYIAGNLLLQLVASAVNVSNLRIFLPLYFHLHRGFFWRFQCILHEVGHSKATMFSLHINMCEKLLD